MNVKMVVCLSSAIVLLTLTGCYGEQQSLSVQPHDIEVTPGHNTTLPCIIKDKQGDCRWQKDGKPVGMFVGKYVMKDEAGGDCSISISNVDLKFDDGLWECQVTASSFEAQDTLGSRKARLTVQVPPESIAIQYAGNNLVEGGVVTLVEERVEKLVCVTRFSNPAPSITWTLGGTLLPSQSQTNISEEVPNKYRSEAVLSFTFQREDLGKRLTCIVRHQAYLHGDGSTHVEIDVHYKPNVRISRVDSSDLEEGVGSVSLTCIADANPPAKVTWKKRGKNPIAPGTGGYDVLGAGETLELSPVRRGDAGTYMCSATNSIGESDQEATEVVVLYSPMIMSMEPAERAEVIVHNRTSLACNADANPEPKYQWLQLLPSQEVKVRSYTKELLLEDVSYSDQGEYVCEAVNLIGGERRVVRSEVLLLEVAGMPQVAKEKIAQEVVAVSGRDVRLEAEFCSDPLPLRNTWEWDSVVLPAGKELGGGKYRAELVEHPQKKDCFLSRLTLTGVGQADSRSYTLSVENIHGIDIVPIRLGVTDPVSMASVIGVVIALLVVFVLLSVILLVAYKKQKLCFKDADLENMVKSKSSQYSTYNGADHVIKNGGSTEKIVLPPSTKV